MDNERLHEIIQSIDLIQRNNVCQLYLIQGLQNSVHFSLGKNGSNKLIEFFHEKGIPLNYFNNKESYFSKAEKFLARKNNPNTKYLVSYVQNPRGGGLSELEREYIQLMTEMGNQLWPVFFGVSMFMTI